MQLWNGLKVYEELQAICLFTQLYAKQTLFLLVNHSDTK